MEKHQKNVESQKPFSTDSPMTFSFSYVILKVQRQNAAAQAAVMAAV